MKSTRWLGSRMPAQAKPPPRPFANICGRIVGRGDRPLILLHNGRGGTRVDFVASRDGETVNLAGGGSIRGRFLIAPPETGVPGAFPYWGGPGIGLWEAVTQLIPPAALQECDSHEARVLTRVQKELLVGTLFDGAAKAGLVIAGRESPARPGQSLTQFESSRHLWDWDLVREQADPRPESCALPLTGIRLIPVDQWLRITGTVISSVQAHRSKVSLRKESVPLQADVNAWMLSYYQKARDEGGPPPKRDEDAAPQCASAIGATQQQIRAALQEVPSDLKRRRGHKDR